MKTLIILTALTFAALLTVNSNSVNAVSFASDSTESKTSAESNEAAKVCPVSGETITGEGSKYSYMGDEYVLCCNGCIKTFKKNPAKYISGGVKDAVCGMADSKAEINTVHDGVKYYFCNESCKAKFEKDPDSYLSQFSK